MCMTNSKIIAVDLFCGGGGTITGMIDAFTDNNIEYEVTGINHWDIAIATNKRNHKGKYYCATLESVDPCKIVPGGILDILWASPECTNHSIAKGGKPKSDQSRCQPEMLLTWIRKLLVKRMYVENVKEFLDWGPLLAKRTKINGKWYEANMPDPRKKGVFFRDWIESIKRSGYRVDYQIMNSADFGAPTSRRRLIIQAVRVGTGEKIVWPHPTHAKEPGLFNEKPWIAAREIIDFSIPGTSIFGRKIPLAVKTLKRIYHGAFKQWDPELLKLYIPPLRQEIIRACKYQPKNPNSKRKPQCPFNVLAELPHVLPSGEDLNSFMVILRGKSNHRDIGSPVPTVTTKSHAHLGLVEPIMIKLRGTCNSSDINNPTPTITAGGNHLGLAEPFITRFNGGGNRNHGLDQPLPVVDTSNRYGIVDPMILDMSHPADQSASRAYSSNIPLKTVTTRNNMAIAAPMIIATGHTSAKDRSRSIDEPLSTIVTKNEHCLVEPLILHQMTPGRTRTVNEPMPAITTKCGHGLISPFIVEFYGNSSYAELDKPLGTVTCRDRFGYVEGEIEDGDVYLIDIRFRMFRTHELSAAQSFPREYKFSGNREDQVMQIGNAVPPALAKAIVSAALPQAAEKSNAA